MNTNLIGRFTLAFGVALALSASPALAQGKSKYHDKDHDKREHVQSQQRRPQLQRRDDHDDRYRRDDRDDRDDRYDRDRRDDRDDRYDRDGRYDRSRRQVPPGWCQGRGNPHNTPENCGYGSRNGSYDRYGRNGTYDRNGGYGSYGTYGRNGSYDQQHREFHRYLDEKYRSLAAQHPLDPRWQLRVSQEKRAEHERWHDRAGVAHR